MHLLQAGVNLIYIRDLLGHADVAQVGMRLKEKLRAKVPAGFAVPFGKARLRREGEAVATSARSFPPFRRSSALSLCSFARLP